METLYSDKLVTITRETITFYHYYLWGRKTVPVNEILKIEGVKPDVNNGQWRLWGTSGPGGWMPLDWRRPSRDRIFYLYYKYKRFQIAFTVEDTAKAEEAFKQLGLMG
jgi:hypothetical protein